MKYLIILVLLLFIPCVSAEHVITFDSDDIENKLIAGSTYEVLSTFNSIDTTLHVNMTIKYNTTNSEEDKVNETDWNVTMFLDGKDVFCNETSAGVFNSSFDVIAGTHDFNISFESVPNILPGVYIITIYYPDTEIITQPPKKKSGGGRRYPTPTPTPMPINATETPTPIPTDELNETEMYINVTEPSQEQDDNNLYLYGIAVTLLAIMVAFLYRKRKGE